MAILSTLGVGTLTLRGAGDTYHRLSGIFASEAEANAAVSGGTLTITPGVINAVLIQGKGLSVWDGSSAFVSVNYNKTEVDAAIATAIGNLTDSAPGVLDTLNELAAAIGDDANFFTTMNNANAAIQADVDANEAAADAAIALRATIESPTFTTKISSPEFHSAGSHLKFKADTNDIIFYPNNTETLQITRHSSTGHPNFTANGGSGEFKFNQVTDLAGGVKLAGVAVTSTAAELNILDGVTATAAELNYVDGVTSAIQTQLDALQTADAELTELATMASASAAAIADLSEAEIQILDGATVTTAELNILDGVTATAAELNYVDGVTSNIQTQLNAIQADVDTNESDADTSLASLSTNINNEGAARLLADNANETHIDNLATLSGVAKDETHLSTFTGSTVADNQTVKAAIQALETAVETKQATDAELTELATMASATAAALADLTEAEVQILDGATVTTAELNILDGVTSTAAELNILDGVTSTAAELNILDGVTSTAAELNILDGVTATAAELNYVDGVTSNVQTQLDAKAALAGATFTGAVVQTPAASVTPGSNGELMVEATNNTTLTFKLKGSDGTVRSGTITLS
jgi:hypothetical protein